MQVDIIEFSAPSRLAWRLGARALFATDESFVLEAKGKGTILAHCVKTWGAFAFLVAPLARKNLRAGMELFDGLLARKFARKSAPAKLASPALSVGSRLERK